MPVGDLSAQALNLQSWLLRQHAELQPCVSQGNFEALAVYPDLRDAPILTFCLKGLLLAEADGHRFIPYTDIGDAGYFGADLLKQEKIGFRKDYLTLVLVSGECIELPLRERGDRFSERLSIGRIIKNLVVRAKL